MGIGQQLTVFKRKYLLSFGVATFSFGTIGYDLYAQKRFQRRQKAKELAELKPAVSESLPDTDKETAK